MTRTSLSAAGLVLGAGVLLAVACGAPAEQQQPAPSTTQTAPSLMSPVSINASMVTIVDHAGHQLWDVEKQGMTPKTDADWLNVEEHATQIAAAGALVQVPGTGINDIVWTQSPGWRKWARAMSDAGTAAQKAAHAKNMEALVTANGQLVESCEGCHKEFKPELPSEGISHVHAH